MCLQWNGSDDLTRFKGLVGRCSANTADGPAVWVCCLLNNQGSVLWSWIFGVRRRSVSKGSGKALGKEPDHYRRSSHWFMLAFVLAVCPPHLDCELWEGGESVCLVRFSFPSVHSCTWHILGAQWIWVTWKKGLQARALQPDCSRVTLDNFLNNIRLQFLHP